MTTPDERTRALLQARDLLQALTQPSRTPGVSDSVRAEARHLLRHFPLAVDVDALANACPDVLARPKQRAG